MPTPEWKKEESRKKRQRVCVICGASFLVKKVGQIGKTCSKACGIAHMSNVQTGRRQSEMTRRRRSESMKAANASDPERAARQYQSAAAGMKKWSRENPDEAAKVAMASSDRMKRRHQDPEWQKVRNDRSSRTMKANWEKYRDEYSAASARRYIDSAELGVGINSEDAKLKKAAAAKWIMTQAQLSLRNNTDYNELFASIQDRVRRENPYNGSSDGDYIDYLAEIGRIVTNDPELRNLADEFFAKAIPEFAREYREKRPI